MRKLSDKAVAILSAIVKLNLDGSFLDIDQLRETLGKTDAYGKKVPSKDTLHFSVRALIAHNLIEKKPLELRRGQNRLVLAATMTGYAEYRELRKA